MAVPFLPLLNLGAGSSAAPAARMSESSALVPQGEGGASFAQAMARLQSKGDEGQVFEPSELAVFSEPDLVFSAELASDLPSGLSAQWHIYAQSLIAEVVTDEVVGEQSLMLHAAPEASVGTVDFEEAETHPVLPGFLPSASPQSASALDEGEEFFSVPRTTLDGRTLAEPSPGFSRWSVDRGAALGVLEQPYAQAEAQANQVKSVAGSAELASQGALRMSTGDLGGNNTMNLFAQELERPRGGEEQKLSEADLKTVLHAERGVSASASPAPTGRVAVPVQVAFGLPHWATDVAERTAKLVGQNIQSAELKLDPPELGPLNVRISVNQEQASVHFVSANPSVREALDQSVARLRELLQEQGLSLVDSGVSDQGPQQDGSGQPSEDRGVPGASSDTDQDETAGELARQSVTLSSGIDDFV